MILGNLFACSFFYDLKESEEASIGLMVGIVILAAVIVAIPVKLGIRLLFRTTQATAGSPEDRVAQVFRFVYPLHSLKLTSE